MTKYLISRLLRGLFSIVIVVAIVMILIYGCLNKDQIFANDSVYVHMKSNAKTTYKLQQWEKYGYVDYVTYAEWMTDLLRDGGISEKDYKTAVVFGDTPSKDNALAAEYIKKFTQEMKADGFEVERMNADKMGNKVKEGGKAALFAYKDVPLVTRLFRYITGIFDVDNINYVEEDIENRGLKFTLYDPVYQEPVTDENGNPIIDEDGNVKIAKKKFSPAIIGNGTQHKYLLYFDSQFPYIHQNLLDIKLGTSYSVRKDVDVFKTLTDSQGAFATSMVTYPTGLKEESADNLHSATYVADSLKNGTAVVTARYIDDYTNVDTNKNGLSKMGYSFVIGIISVVMAYALAIPLGTIMALKKDKFIDKLGTLYIVFIMAVPSLAYIFMFKAIGRSRGLPDTFDMTNPTWLMYVLPIISLALPSIANLMKWLRRYMIDQMNSDYVKFARAGGLSEGEIFRKHVLKNAIIPIIHGIPGSVLGALTGAIITERVYVVPGAGNMLTEAINAYDNGVIVGMTLFYAVLSVTSVILGDILMSLMDPRISFVTKKGGK